MKEKTAELLDLLEEIQVELRGIGDIEYPDIIDDVRRFREILKGRLKVGDKVRFTNEYRDRTGNFYIGAIEVDNYYPYVLVADPANIGMSSDELLRKYSEWTRDYDVAEVLQIELGWASKADMMFEELGYDKTQDNDKVIFYEKFWVGTNCTETIAIDMEEKMVEISYDKDNIVASFNVEQHLAIHERLKELEWLENE